jgi:hypothetical protein
MYFRFHSFVIFYKVPQEKIFPANGFFKNKLQKNTNYKPKKKRKFYLDYSLNNGKFF